MDKIKKSPKNKEKYITGINLNGQRQDGVACGSFCSHPKFHCPIPVAGPTTQFLVGSGQKSSVGKLGWLWRSRPRFSTLLGSTTVGEAPMRDLVTTCKAVGSWWWMLNGSRKLEDFLGDDWQFYSLTLRSCRNSKEVGSVN